MSNIPATTDFQARARNIRFLVCDFDGVFTDNSVWTFADGSEAIRCCRADGIGLKRLAERGIPAVVITNELNPIVAARCAKLGLPVQAISGDKLPVLHRLAEEHGVSLDQVAYLGNDRNDLSCLEAVHEAGGLAIVTQDAEPSCYGPLGWRRYGHTQLRGGEGAVREVCERIIEAQG